VTPTDTAGPAPLLVISYHFGDSGATGGFRWAAHVRGLAARGWDIDVITSDTPTMGDVANVRVHRVPPVHWPVRVAAALTTPLRVLTRRASGAKPSSAPAPVPVDERRAMLQAHASALPVWRPGMRLPNGVLLRRAYDDALGLAADIHWARAAARLGTQLARQRAHRLVLVSTPPHATQLAGHLISRRLGIPYISDYRDPWSYGVPELEGYLPPLTRRVHHLLERRVQRSTALLIHNTAQARARAAAQPALPPIPRASVANGYDAEIEPTSPDPAVFRILVAGHIYPYMDPRTLMSAVRLLRERSGELASRIRLEFLGSPSTVNGMPLEDLVAGLGVDDCTTITPRVSREEALLAQQRAAVLVAFDYPHPLAVPMRVYDYLRARGSLLVFTSGDSALAHVAQRIGSQPVPPSDVDATLRFLQTALERWQQQAYPAPNDARGEFARHHQTLRVDRLLRLALSGPLDPATVLEV
jgi:hypothetical protein